MFEKFFGNDEGKNEQTPDQEQIKTAEGEANKTHLRDLLASRKNKILNTARGYFTNPNMTAMTPLLLAGGVAALRLMSGEMSGLLGDIHHLDPSHLLDAVMGAAGEGVPHSIFADASAPHPTVEPVSTIDQQAYDARFNEGGTPQTGSAVEQHVGGGEHGHYRYEGEGGGGHPEKTINEIYNQKNTDTENNFDKITQKIHHNQGNPSATESQDHNSGTEGNRLSREPVKTDTDQLHTDGAEEKNQGSNLENSAKDEFSGESGAKNAGNIENSINNKFTGEGAGKTAKTVGSQIGSGIDSASGSPVEVKDGVAHIGGKAKTQAAKTAIASIRGKLGV